MIRNIDKPIFLQLADVIKSRIIDGSLKPDDKIPSVRELAAEYEVNNNTVMRSVELLSGEGIIYQKRGMGYFVSLDAENIIKEQQYETFLSQVVPQMKKMMSRLGITPDQVAEILKKDM